MIESSNSEIDVEKLMERIREEIRQRKMGFGLPPTSVPSENDANFSTSQNRTDLPKIPSIGGSEKFATSGRSYHINDFLKYHDHQFIINAYRGILGRRPDSNGYDYYLNNLRAGKMSKAEILGRLRYSPQGRARKVHIKSLFWNFVIQSSFHIPVLGYFSRLTTGIANLPLIIRNIQTLEKNMHLVSKQQRTHINAAYESVRKVLDQKADINELDNIKSELLSLLVNKVEKEEIKAVNDQIFDILRQTREQKLNIIDQQRRLELFLEEAQKRLPAPFSEGQINMIAKEKEHLLDPYYACFEDRFRGTREDIRKRLDVYLPYISKAGIGKIDSPIIDVGCGRGEWLEFLKFEGLVARGVDVNATLVEECRGLGLDVVNEEALEYLRKLPSNSVGAVTGFHIIEHLPPVSLIGLLDEALRVLKPGGVSIFETPNPENILVASFKFYFDPTHRNPLPPELFNFLVESRGFCKTEILRLHPDEPDMRIRDDGSELVKRFNQYFYGPMDYAVIGYTL